MSEATWQEQIKVTLVKSLAGQLKNIRRRCAGLGLRTPHQTVEVADTPQNRGMIDAATHLLKVEEAECDDHATQ